MGKVVDRGGETQLQVVENLHLVAQNSMGLYQVFMDVCALFHIS